MKTKQLILILALIALTCTWTGCQIARAILGKATNAANSVLDYAEGISTNAVKAAPVIPDVVK